MAFTEKLLGSLGVGDVLQQYRHVMAEAAHRELRLNLAGNAGPANLARTHLHSMGPSKNASNTFSNHFATGFLCLIMHVWALLPSKVQNFEREIQT